MYSCFIYIFEPVKEFYEKINNRFCYNTKIKVLNTGIGGSNRIEKIGISNDGISIFINESDTETITITDISEWINQTQIDTIDLIKINIEGGEYELVSRLIETGIVKKIKNIQVQFHNIENDSKEKMTMLQEKLKKTHYLTFQYEFVWENWALKND